MGEAEVHDAAEYTMNIGIAGYTVDYMIRAFIIKPLAFIDLGVCRFWRFEESEIADDYSIIFNHKATVLLHITSYDSLRRVAFSPLVHIARLPHYLLCSIHDFHNLSHVRWPRFSDYPAHGPTA